MDNNYYLLVLNRIHQIGPRTVLKLIERWPQLEELFKLTREQFQKVGLPAKLTEAIKKFDFSEVEADLRWSEQKGNHLLTFFDPSYPKLLKEIYDPPPVLYAKGELAGLGQTAIAIVGSRKPSVSGAETAKRFAYELAVHQLTIISGLALGIDAQAHRGCLEAEGKTIAVMGTGIDCIYPRQHHELADKICQKGLLITEFPLKTSPKAGHFPRRNRIISGLSLVTLIVEAAIRSGSLITARLALEQNRDILAIPGSIHNPQAQGCHYLLQQGAKLVTSSKDILEELGFEPLEQVKGPARFATDNGKLVKFIGFEVTTVDQIMVRSGLDVQEVACGIATLEIEGLIKAVPGGYMRCTE